MFRKSIYLGVAGVTIELHSDDNELTIGFFMIRDFTDTHMVKFC